MSSSSSTFNSRPIHAYFARLNLNATERWIEESINVVRNQQGITQMPAIIKSCFERWLATDLASSDAIQSSEKLLPVEATRATTLKLTVPAGRAFALQVVSAYDVGQPLFAQVQKLNNVRDENSRVSAEDNSQRPYTAAWQPTERRMIKLTLTDGRKTVEALEHEPMQQLADQIRPGAKLVVSGPVVCRRGVMMLTAAAVKFHGGFVPELRKSHVATLKDAMEVQQQQQQRQQQQQGAGRGRGRGDSLPTQKYVQGSKVMVMKNGERVEKLPRQTFSSRAPLVDLNNVMGDDLDVDDSFFAAIDMPGSSAGGGTVEDVFDDGEDDLFSQMPEVFDDDDDAMFSQMVMPSPPPQFAQRGGRGRGRVRGARGAASSTGVGRGRGRGRGRPQNQQSKRRRV
jgi:hypothetical protein